MQLGDELTPPFLLLLDLLHPTLQQFPALVYHLLNLGTKQGADRAKE
jgi:hypothetical protein